MHINVLSVDSITNSEQAERTRGHSVERPAQDIFQIVSLPYPLLEDGPREMGGNEHVQCVLSESRSMMYEKSIDLSVQRLWFITLILPFVNCVALVKSINYEVSNSSHIQKG